MMIKDFIGVYPNAMSDELCDELIKSYQYMERFGHVTNRQKHTGASKMIKDTEFAFLNNYNEPVMGFTNAFWECYRDYASEYGILDDLKSHQFYDDIKIQKSQPTTGYHAWHCETAGRQSGSRLLLAIGYLNDVEEGGETEFLYQAKRIPARKGTIMICPAAFTHTHRGNPPLSGDKYIINGWIEFTE
jgi:hypothetical protein